jgi:Fe-S-cluster containining protein
MNRSKVSNTPEDNKGTTYSYDVCSNCKIICCQDAKPPLSSNRKKIILEYLKSNNIEIAEPFTTEKYSYPSLDNEHRCVFNDKQTKRCMIHSVKPETCVAGPITFGINMRKGMVEFFLKKSEICAYAGILFNDKPALMAHYRVARAQIIELIKQLSAEELLAINAIEEPETFKFCEEPLPPEVARKLDL